MSGHRRFTVLGRGLAWRSLAALLLCLPAAAEAQLHSLTIRVTDPVAAPVPNARVSVAPRDGRLVVFATTGRDGVARVDRLMTGAYVLEIAADGFTPAVRTLIVDGSPAGVDVSLAIAAVTEHVIVTAAGRLQGSSETSETVTVVDAGEIAARQELSVADALRTVPGVTVHRLGGAGAFASVKLRGLREQDTSILIDGVRLRDAASPQGDATAFIGDLHIANLDRIEVLRGPASAMYGSHAIAGAVNLITASGAGRPAAAVSAEAGALGFTRVTAHTSGGVLADALTFGLGAGRTHTRRGIDGDDDARNTSLQARTSARLGTARATLRVFATDARSSLNESPAAIRPLPAEGIVEAGPDTFVSDVNDPDDVRASDLVSALFLFEQRPASGFGYTASFHRVDTSREFDEGPLGTSPFEPAAPASVRFEGTVETLDVRADREWSARHTTRFSYELERERYVSRTRPADASLAWDADITQHSHAVAVRHEARFASLHVAGSLRAQRVALDDVVLTPEERSPFAAAAFASPPSALTADLSAVRLLAATGTKLRAHVGNAYRAPAMFERAGAAFGSAGYSVFGDPGIGPERSVAMDAGIEQAVAQERALLSATWFHARLTRVITFQFLDAAADPLGRTSGYAPADGRTVRGVELSARVRPHRTLQAMISYTFADAPPAAGGRDGLPRANALPAHQLSAAVTQRVGPVQMSLDLEAAGDHYVTLFDPVSFGSRAYRFAPFAKADLAASYRFGVGRRSARLFGAIDNVFDHRYFVQGFRAAGRAASAGVAVTF